MTEGVFERKHGAGDGGYYVGVVDGFGYVGADLAAEVGDAVIDVLEDGVFVGYGMG